MEGLARIRELAEVEFGAKFVCLFMKCSLQPSGFSLDRGKPSVILDGSGLKEIALVVEAMRDATMAQEVTFLFEFPEFSDQLIVVAKLSECLNESL